jgi:hypothetical protein
MTVPEFRRCLKNYFDSEGVTPGGRPCTYLRKLPDYWAGPKNKFNQLLENRNGNHQEEALTV